MLARSFPLLFLAAASLAPIGRAQCAAGEFLATDAETGDQFGNAAAVDGDTAVIGAYRDVVASVRTGSAYVFEREGTGWAQKAQLVAADGQADDWFGYSVDIDGDTIVVGAWHDGHAGFVSGSAYVFERTAPFASTWAQTQKLTASDAFTGDSFGWSVSIEQDTILIGAFGDDDAGNWAGAAYVFERSAGVWSQTQKLFASDAEPSSGFGRAVDLDGNRALIGSHTKNVGFLSLGQAYVFERGPGGWSEVAILSPSTASLGASFGATLDLSGDRALVSAKQDGVEGPLSGSVFLFDRGPSGVWTETAKLTASDGAADDQFGWWVGLEGSTAFVSAPFKGLPNPSKSGKAYVFQLTPSSGWVETETFLPTTAEDDDRFGISLALDGTTGLVGSDGDGSATGRVYAYAMPGAGCISGSVDEISLLFGGTQEILVQAGAQFAGLTYLLLGTVSGTSPGLPIDGLLLPLNVDAYTLQSLLSPNNPPLFKSLGTLDAMGEAKPRFHLFSGSPPELAGLTLHHAYVVIELLPTLLHIVVTSHPLPLKLVP